MLKRDCVKISVVTVCYNMVDYIETTIKSVLSQEYPNLEYIIIDGGSTDGTLEIIEKYRSQLAYFISEPDEGMYDAIQKGFQVATGEVCAWINADDILLPWALSCLNDIFTAFPKVSWINAKNAYLNENGTLAQIYPKVACRTQKDISNGWCREELFGPLQQENMFWRRSLYQQVGGIDASFKYAGDFELWMRFAEVAQLVRVDIPLAAFRKRITSLGAVARVQYFQEMDRAATGKPKYPNFMWWLCRGSKILVQLLRMLRFRSGEIIFYSNEEQRLQIKKLFHNYNNHDVQSLLIYK